MIWQYIMYAENWQVELSQNINDEKLKLKTTQKKLW